MISRGRAKIKRYLVMTLTLLTATIALSISIETLSLNSAAVAQLPPAGSKGHLAQDPMQEISLTLSSSGFNPAEVRPQSGRFLLSIDNRSGASDLVFRLSRPDGTLIRELRMSGAGGDWNEAFDLSAGTYTLSETNHSTWVCTIIVQ
jgi:hypothetical protein